MVRIGDKDTIGLPNFLLMDANGSAPIQYEYGGERWLTMLSPEN
jgi:hypothetical protein